MEEWRIGGGMLASWSWLEEGFPEGAADQTCGLEQVPNIPELQFYLYTMEVILHLTEEGVRSQVRELKRIAELAIWSQTNCLLLHN